MKIRMLATWLTLVTLVVVYVLNSVPAEASTREDPLRPPGYKVTDSAKADDNKVKTWFVNEILHSEGRRIAIVNNKTVKKGDIIDGATVIEITARQVTLKYEDRIINAGLSLVPVKTLKTNTTGR